MTVLPDKLLVILPTDGHGGCEYNALSVAQFAQDRLGIAVTVAFPMRPSTAFLSELCNRNGLAAIDLAIGFEADDDAGRLSQQAEAVARLLVSAKPDVVFLAMPWPARGTGLVTALGERGAKTLVKFALVPERLYGPPAHMLPRLREAKRAGQIWFANSRHSAALLESHFGLPDGTVEHFHVGPIGLDSLVAPTGDDKGGSVKAEFGLGADAVLVTTIGRLARQKGYDTFAAALRGLAPGDAALHFLWVGEGEMRAELETALAETGLASRVTFAGFRTDVRRLLRASDIFAFPTVYEGGCSQALLEAMEEGLPIVVSGIAGVREVVADGDTACWCRPVTGTR